MSPAALYRSVAIFEICERIQIRSWKHVSTAHIRLVLPLPLNEQERLLRAVEDNKWPARRLDAVVAELTNQSGYEGPARGGRKRVSTLRKRTQSLDKIVSSLAEDDGREPSPESARHAIQALRKVRQACATLERRFERYVPGSTTTAPPPPDGDDDFDD
jgi:hypothetical protein